MTRVNCVNDLVKCYILVKILNLLFYLFNTVHVGLNDHNITFVFQNVDASFQAMYVEISVKCCIQTCLLTVVYSKSFNNIRF